MQVPHRRQALPLRLANLVARRQALVFKRLILFQNDLEDEQPVRHYDQECEGVVMLLGLLKKKQQAALIKGFQAIRLGPSLTQKRAPATEKKALTATTRRTIHALPLSSLQSNHLQVPGVLPSTHRAKHNNENSLAASSVRSTSSRLEGILSRLKQVNSTSQLTGHGLNQRLNAENTSFFGGDSRSRLMEEKLGTQQHLRKNYSAEQLDAKLLRREFILNKLARIESSLSDLNCLSYEEAAEIRHETNNFRKQLHAHHDPAQ